MVDHLALVDHQLPDGGQQASTARKQNQNSYLCAPSLKPDGLRGGPNWKGETFKKGVKQDTRFANKKSNSRLKNLPLSILLGDNIPPPERGEMLLGEFLTTHPKEKQLQSHWGGSALGPHPTPAPAPAAGAGMAAHEPSRTTTALN